MLLQRLLQDPIVTGPVFDLHQAQRAPVPQQVAEPNPTDDPDRLAWLLEVAGNMLGGGLLLALLLAAPFVVSRLLGPG